MIEFTGERLVPDQVDPDLWNEHIARYCFAARLARNKRVLDVACGLGYGSAELAKVAASVQAIDISTHAIEEARRRYASPNIQFTAAAAQSIPFPDGSFDLIVAFEVIEHLQDWPSLLSEAHRLLAPGGQLILSTPNKSFYAETRRLAGPNPFHAHEFDFTEFRDALMQRFTAVTLFLQNHVAAIAFQPVHHHHAAELSFEPSTPEPESTHFFLAVCATAPQTGAPLYLYLPATANVLKEREAHIAKLERELAQKDKWLAESQLNHAALLESHHALEKANSETIDWAQRLDQEIVSIRLQSAGLEEQLLTMRAAIAETVAGYEAKIEELESDLAARTASALENETRLESELAAKTNELAACVKLLQEAEALAEERTRWALSLDGRIAELESTLAAAGSSRWLRLGRKLGIGPQLQS